MNLQLTLSEESILSIALLSRIKKIDKLIKDLELGDNENLLKIYIQEKKETEKLRDRIINNDL